MEDNEITEENTDFSENLSITSASHFQAFLYTNSHQFGKPAALRSLQKAVSCCGCPDGHT